MQYPRGLLSQEDATALKQFFGDDFDGVQIRFSKRPDRDGQSALTQETTIEISNAVAEFDRAGRLAVLAQELTHVIQHMDGRIDPDDETCFDRLTAEAEVVAAVFMSPVGDQWERAFFAQSLLRQSTPTEAPNIFKSA